MGSVNAFPGAEIPGYGTAEAKTVQTGGILKIGKADLAQVINNDFKKKLESCAIVDLPVMIMPETGSLLTQDHSMATTDTAAGQPSELVGILEGFGLLDYQKDNSDALAGTAPETMGAAADVTSGAAADAAADMTAKQTQMSQQFAWMLNEDQPDALPQDVQQQVIADAGKYSGSLESTNNEMSFAGQNKPAADEMAALLLKTKMVSDNTPRAAANAPAGEPMVKPAGQPAAGQTGQSATGDQSTAGQTGQSATGGQSTAGQTGQSTAGQTGQPVNETAAAAGNADTKMPEEAEKSMQAQAAALPQEEATEKAVKTVAKPETGTDGHSAAADTAGISAKAVTQTGMTQAGVAQTGTTHADATHTDTAANTAATETTGQDFVRDNVIRIVDKVSTNAQEGRYEFDVDLKPDFLGKVSIKLTMKDGEICMHVKTEDAAVKGLFSDQAGSLQSSLKEKGIVLSTVDVSYQDPATAGQQNSGQSAHGNGHKKGNVGKWNADRSLSGDLYDAAVSATELLGGSSVEYLA